MLAALLVFGATVATTKFVLEITSNPVLSDEEWARQSLLAEDVFETDIHLNITGTDDPK
jgi:hypothetical protein